MCVYIFTWCACEELGEDGMNPVLKTREYRLLELRPLCSLLFCVVGFGSSYVGFVCVRERACKRMRL